MCVQYSGRQEDMQGRRDRSHQQRAVMSAIPRREREDVQAELIGIWKQVKKEPAFHADLGGVL
jgi:hypothetical protein